MINLAENFKRVFPKTFFSEIVTTITRKVFGVFCTFITKWNIENRTRKTVSLQIGAILLHFKILGNVYPELKPTRYWLKPCRAFLFQSIWDAKIMVTFWLQLSDKVTFEDDYTVKFFFRTFHVNIFFILRNKGTTCKKIIVIYYAIL